jgi:predicted enzyme related to lactoylglutathione lyase
MAIEFDVPTPIFPVRDLEISTDYYVRVLGFEVQFHEPGIITCVGRGRCVLFLIEGDQGNPPSYLYAGVSDVDALLEEITAQGATILHPPTNYAWGYEMHVADPDGNVLRLASDRKRGVPDGEWRDMRGTLWTPLGGGRWKQSGTSGT